MSFARSAAFLVGVVVATVPTGASADEVLDLSGEVSDDGTEFVMVPFEVAGGVTEIEVEHKGLSGENVLDWGLLDPAGHRGWGGGNEESVVVGVASASRGYVPGPLPTGTWRVVIGKALIKETPARYQLQVTLRDAPTLASQPERSAYEPSPALERGARWYAGDFHLHSRESGDATPTLDEIASFARGRGLDFVVVTDHNVVTQQDFYRDAQPRHPHVLLIPGFELTTYAGHANVLGGTRWVDHKIGFGGMTIEKAATEVRDRNALFMINHPTVDLGDLCIGCAWKHDLGTDFIDAVEVGSGSALKTGVLFGDSAVAFWESVCATGRHAAALGGSDDHKAGVDLDAFQSPIGDPTTLVFAEELSVEGILSGVRAGRTVVKLRGPEDPMIELTPSVAADGDTVSAARVTLRASVSGGEGHTVRFVRNGEPQAEVDVVGDPFVHAVSIAAPERGEDFWRAEVLLQGRRRTLTSHVFVRMGPGGEAEAGGGCACRAGGKRSERGRDVGLSVLLLLGWVVLRRR
jgi:hypothetical protein